MFDKGLEQVITFKLNHNAPLRQIKPGIRKRKYSRSGCDECKRRKMKCDETKPYCYNCTRLKKHCVYQSKHKFKFENTDHLKGVATTKRNYPATIPETGSDLVLGIPKNASVDMTQPLTQARLSAISVQPLLNQNVNTPSYPLDYNQTIDMNDMRMLLDEASLLVSDINDLTGLEVFNENSNSVVGSVPNRIFRPSSESGLSDNSDNFQLEEFSSIFSAPYSLEISTKDDELSISNTELIDQIIQYHKLTNPHISYLKVLTTTDLSYHLFPFASSIESNEVVKLLLKYLHTCSYLLTSLLAISATFQYNQTGKKIHDLSRQKYTAICLKLLSQAFVKTGVEKLGKDVVTGDIERLLLTVLMLTSNFTSRSHGSTTNMVNSWKVHLIGARDLLTNYGQLAQSSTYIFGGLALAKTWFYSIEALASLYSPLGGTFRGSQEYKEDEDFDKDNNEAGKGSFIGTGNFGSKSPYQDALIRIGLLKSVKTKGKPRFNLYAGFTDKVVNLIDAVIQGITFLREHPNQQISPKRVTKIMSLIDECYETEIVPKFCRQTYIIPRDSPGHPDFDILANKITLPKSAYGTIHKRDGTLDYFSWFDLSEQIRTHGIHLKFLTTKGFLGLPRSHPLVRKLVQKICNSVIFIKQKDAPEYSQDQNNILTETTNYYLTKDQFDNRAIMIQSAIKFCSKLVDNEADFEKLEIYLLGLVKLGNGSALSALDLLYHYREQWRKRQLELSPELQPDLYFNDRDIEDELELDSIPFA